MEQFVIRNLCDGLFQAVSSLLVSSFGRGNLCGERSVLVGGLSDDSDAGDACDEGRNENCGADDFTFRHEQHVSFLCMV